MMTRILHLLSALLLCQLSVAAQSLEEKLRELDHVMERRDTYYMLHEHRLDSLKSLARKADPKDARQTFRLNHAIYDAYRSYQNDSARVYVDKEMEAARRAGDDDMLAIARYDDIFTYLSKGDFTNAVASLNATDLSGVNDSIKAETYVLAARLYSDLSNFTSERYEDNYALKSKEYGYMASSLARPGSYASQLATFFLDGNPRNHEERIAIFNEIISRKDVSVAVKAMFYSMLGDLYIADGQVEKGLIHKAQSAIMDIQSATRETTSKHFLAYRLLGMGDVNRASKYIHVALEDAQNYNAPQRKAEIGQALMLIEASRYTNIKEERNMLWAVLMVSVLFIIVVTALFIYIRRQNRRLRTSQSIIGRQNEEIKGHNEEIRKKNQEIVKKNEEITKKNEEITEAYDSLTHLNAQLRESIKIKDEYLGYVFHLISEYIKKIETIYKLVNLKLTVRQPDDLKKMLPMSDIRLEKEKMLKEFDRIFLSLFPTFIEQYQQLFEEDDELSTLASADGILTPEMRIFALIRLGVSDIGNIAQFLNYSVNTINTYKTKAKKRSLVDNEEFEDCIMEIKSVK